MTRSGCASISASVFPKRKFKMSLNYCAQDKNIRIKDTPASNNPIVNTEPNMSNLAFSTWLMGTIGFIK
jgi:hypothetical protein